MQCVHRSVLPGGVQLRLNNVCSKKEMLKKSEQNSIKPFCWHLCLRELRVSCQNWVIVILNFWDCFQNVTAFSSLCAFSHLMHTNKQKSELSAIATCSRYLHIQWSVSSPSTHLSSQLVTAQHNSFVLAAVIFSHLSPAAYAPLFLLCQPFQGPCFSKSQDNVKVL